MHTNLPSWISKEFKETKSGLVVDGVVLNKLTEIIKPPFFIYSATDIKNRYQDLEKALKSSGIKLYYSVKANSLLSILNGLVFLGSGLEVASIGELELAIKIKVNPSKVSFAGPVKTESELESAIRFGIKTINAESFVEIERINAIAKRLGKKQVIGIRVNPLKQVNKAGGLMGGGSQKFGIDFEKITQREVDKIRSLPNVELSGLHVFSATQILTPKEFINNLENTCRIARDLNNLYKIKYIDFGGGLGIPYFSNEHALDIKDLSNKIKTILAKFPFIKANNTSLYLEPGRYIVGSSGIYVVRVDHVKDSRGITYVMVDGGWQHMMRTSPSMPFGQHPIYNLSKPNKLKMKKFDIGGSLCTSVDMLGKSIKLPFNTQEGDLIGVFNAGAYGRNQSPIDFLSHPTPSEVLVGKGEYVLARRSEGTERITRVQPETKTNLFKP
jgi:diaminopimelate decarboxylase